MNQNLRNSGIDTIGHVPWGTHFCQFYQTKEDLMDILVPYFKAGLEKNEFCMWVTSQPLDVEEAKEALRKSVPDLDIYLEKGQIEIIPYTHWYVKEGVFDSDRVLNGWVEKLNQALANGYDGLRLTGNTFWLEKEDWKDFFDYEEEVDRVLSNYHMIALCTYCLDKCNAQEIIDVVVNHQFALIKREGKWEQIESSKRKETEKTAIQATKNWEHTFDSVPDLIAILDDQFRIVRANRAMAERFGVTPEECVGLTCYRVVHGMDEPPSFCPHKQLLADGYEHTTEVHEDSLGGDFIVSVSPMHDSEGKIAGCVHVARNITERKQAEESLREAYENLQGQSEELQSQSEEIQAQNEELQVQSEELQESNEALRKSEEHYRMLFTNMTEAFYLVEVVSDKDGKPCDYRFLEVNPAYELNMGIKTEQMLGKSLLTVFPNVNPITLEKYYEIAISGQPANFEVFSHVAGDKYLDVYAFSPEKGKLAVIFRDITERKLVEQERETTVEFLRLVNNSKGTSEIVLSAVNFFRERSGFEAVGIRLKNGDDYPYFEARGFTEEFMKLENNLCVQDTNGQLYRDSNGYPIHECMCGNVICGRFDSSKPFFTTRGSFCTNCTTELLATTTDADRQTRTRNRCNGEGYESVALIALRVGEECFGLLQLNDKRKGRFSPETIAMWERLADYLAVALAKTRAEEALYVAYENLQVQSEELQVQSEELQTQSEELQSQSEEIQVQNEELQYQSEELREANEALSESEEQYRALAENSPDIIARFDRQKCHIYANPAAGEPYGHSPEKIVGKTNSELGMSPELVKFWEGHYENVFTTGKPKTMEFQYISPQGKKYCFDTRIVPEFVNGKVTSILAISRDITDIKEAEAKLEETLDNLENLVKERTADLENAYNLLKESETSLSEAQRTAHLGNWDWNIVTNELYWSDELYHIFGLSPRELGATYDTFLNYVHPNDRDYVNTAIIEALNGNPYSIDHRIILANGEVHAVHEQGEVTFDRNNSPVRMRGTVQDITERKHMEDALRQSEHRYRTLFNSIDEGFCIIEMIFDANGEPVDYRFLETNPAFEKQTGMHEATGKTMREFVPNHEEHWFETYGAIVLTGEPKRFINEAKSLMGGWYDVYACQFGGRESNKVAIVFNDITERKRMEEALESVALLPQENPNPVIRLSQGLIINYANQAAQVLLTDWDSDISHEAPTAITEIAVESLGDGFKRELEYNYADRTYLVNFSPFPQADYVNLYARDITERKKAEEILKMKLEELRRSNEELEQFAYVSSHDLQEPLRMISSYLQLLQRRYQGRIDEKADKYIYYAVDGAARMQVLINDLLDFSRVTSKAREPEPTDSEFVLNQVLSNLDLFIKQNEATVSHDPLPEVMADNTQLAQVFQNLVANGIKFHGKEAPKIHISAQKKENEWLFSVKDNGIGINPQYSEKIFEVFKRLHKKEEYPGTGIGLAICKKIIERHSGRIWVESELDKGATFYFTLTI